MIRLCKHLKEAIRQSFIIGYVRITNWLQISGWSWSSLAWCFERLQPPLEDWSQLNLSLPLSPSLFPLSFSLSPLPLPHPHSSRDYSFSGSPVILHNPLPSHFPIFTFPHLVPLDLHKHSPASSPQINPLRPEAREI